MPLSDMGTEREGERARRWPLMANRVLIADQGACGWAKRGSTEESRPGAGCDVRREEALPAGTEHSTRIIQLLYRARIQCLRDLALFCGRRWSELLRGPTFRTAQGGQRCFRTVSVFRTPAATSLAEGFGSARYMARVHEKRGNTLMITVRVGRRVTRGGVAPRRGGRAGPRLCVSSAGSGRTGPAAGT